MNHCVALFLKDQREQQNQELLNKTLIYIAQGIQIISENVAYCGAYYGADGKQMASFIDYIDDRPKVEKSADEIVDDVLDRCGFLGG